MTPPIAASTGQFSGGILNRFSYPKQPGDQPWCVADFWGPSNYTPVTPGHPPTGGQRIAAQDFALVTIDWVLAMGDHTGDYSIVVIPANFEVGNAVDAVLLKWITATGSQVAAGTDLSSFIVRLIASGH